MTDDKKRFFTSALTSKVLHPVAVCLELAQFRIVLDNNDGHSVKVGHRRTGAINRRIRISTLNLSSRYSVKRLRRFC